MYFLVADEAVHQQTDPNKFFIYGAIIVEHSKLASITAAVESIRQRHNFGPGDSLKFSPNDRPKHISRDVFLEAKSDLLDVAIKHEVGFIGYSLLHAIGKNCQPHEIITRGADAILTKFQQFLVEKENSRGIAMFDTLPIPHPNSYLRQAFQFRMEHVKEGHRLPNIDMVCTTTDGCSHLTSVCDVCVGSFRYAVNEPERDVAGKQLMRKLKQLFWVRKANGRIYPLERGLLMRPVKVSFPAYAADYDEVKTRLFAWMNSKD